MTETPCSLNVFAVPPVERISTPVCAKPFANETTPVLSETLTIALLIFPICSPPNTKFEYRNPKQISHGQLATPACGRQARTMKTPLPPPPPPRGRGRGEGPYSAFSNPHSAFQNPSSSPTRIMRISVKEGFRSWMTITLQIRLGELQSTHFPTLAQGTSIFSRLAFSGAAKFFIL